MVQTEQVNDDFKDDDRPSNTLEWFTDLEEVLEMIDNLRNVYNSGFEKAYEKFSELLTRYQDQPHLLDPHLTKLIDALLLFIHDDKSPPTLVNGAFKYMYQISKVRTYKVLVKFLPHELSDFEYVLVQLENQNLSDSDNWETRYMLLLWMSILVLNPFHMSRLDAFSPTKNDAPTHEAPLTKMERIYKLCQVNCKNSDACANVAAFLAAKYLIRTDVKDSYLPKFFDWIINEYSADPDNIKFGQLAAISAILKHGKREDLLPHVNKLLKWMLECDFKSSSDFLKYKYDTKIIQRLGLVFLKPRLAQWRYQRGSRSLLANLSSVASPTDQLANNLLQNLTAIGVQQRDDEIDVPDGIEEIIEELLQRLRSASSDVRWSAAKGLGRITNRLPKNLGDEIAASIIEIFSPIEPHEAWHGACLAIAELAKRGLLLPHRLSVMVPLLLQALVYDEVKGNMTVGQHIRDAACYMSWAFARAYNPQDLQPFVNEIACGLLITAVFDREINCRRAASAAFQESVGRLGNFPHGIDILTAADFYTVGIRRNSFLQISEFIAQYDEYTNALIDHLIEKKINHWDTAIRELSAKTLYKLTKKAPTYIVGQVIPKLFKMTDSIDINSRHGSVLALGEIALALRQIEIEEYDLNIYLTQELIANYNGLLLKFLKREQFRGMSGEIMKQCCADFIRNCSIANIKTTTECLETWQTIIDKCLVTKANHIQNVTTAALNVLCSTYYAGEDNLEKNKIIVDVYLKGSENDLEEHIRTGYLSALGALPKFMIQPHLDRVITMLTRQSLLPCSENTPGGENPITASWSEARRDSIKALTNVIISVGFDSTDNTSIGNEVYLGKIFDCLLNAMDEYTIDYRGDIGACVREASMNALYVLMTTCPGKLLKPEIVHEVMTKFAQQAVEKIDRTRGLAGKLFCNLIHHIPEIPHIKRHDVLKETFPADSSSVLWLFADHTFPMFCSLLALEEYSERVLLGLTASIGQLTESLTKHSSSSLFQFLKAHPEHVPRIGNEILTVFQKNILNDRVTYPMLNLLGLLISSGTIHVLLCDENSKWPEEIYRLVNHEIKGHKKLYKLVSSINVYCQLIQVPRLTQKIFAKLAVFLGLPHVLVRKTTSFKLFESLILYDEVCGFSESDLDEITTLLTETDWGLPLNDVRLKRNELCGLLGIKTPVNVNAGK